MQVGSRATVMLRHSLAHFSQIRIVLGLIFQRTNYSFTKMKSYLDTHLIVVHVVTIASEDV
jgi:hypothetical protein